MTQRTLGIGLTLVAAAMACSAQDGRRQVIEVGGTRVVVEPWNHGVSIAVGGVRVSIGSNMVVTRPPWAPHYYLGPSKQTVETAVREPVEGGERMRMSHHGDHDAFVGEDTIIVTQGRVERVLEGRFTLDEGDALIQWQIAGLSPVLIIGRQYRAELAEGQIREGVVPVVAQSAEVQPATLASGFKWIEFDSRIGPVRVTVDSEHKLTCWDYRRNRWADPARPVFWLGDMGTRFHKGEPLKYRIVFDLPTPERVVASEPAPAVDVLATERPDAQTWPVEDPPIVIPRPKEAEFAAGGFTVTSLDNVRTEPGAEADSARALLASILVDDFGARPPRAPTADQSPERPILFAKSTDPNLPTEGYRLAVSEKDVRIEAGDPAGFRHAVQTLRQLTSRRPGGGILIRAAKIRDWPSLKFRGVHLFTGGQGPELHQKLLRNVIGALKMNYLVLECEYIKWDSHPEIAHPQYGMSKDDVRKILAAARDADIEVIPLVMSLGHCQWMFTNDTNLDLAEDPDAKYAYCVTNPKTYEFIHEIYSEAIELFQPTWFHVGHDEFHHRGRVPYRESSKPYTVEQLFMMDTLRHHDWLAERGIKMMMWSDMLLGPGDGPDACSAASDASAAELREKLPKDVLIADWHYVDADPAKYVDLEKLAADSLTAVAATWWRPGNVTHFAKAAFEKKALGLLQTTWAGYSLDPERFQKEIQQYTMYVLAAEAAWNADDPPAGDGYPAGSYFFDLMGLSALKPGQHSGWTADLRKAYNTALAVGDAADWFGLGREQDLSGVPGGLARLKGLSFELGETSKPGVPAALALRGKLATKLPAEAELRLGRKAAQLAILHTVNFPCEAGTKVAKYELMYDDGTSSTLDAIYGRNVLAYTDLSASADAPVVWQGQTSAGQPVALRVVIWNNPQPEKVIRALTARSADALGSLVVLGVTGLEAGSAD